MRADPAPDSPVRAVSYRSSTRTSNLPFAGRSSTSWSEAKDEQRWAPVVEAHRASILERLLARADELV